MLVENEWIKSHYYFSGNNITEYGLLILSKWPAYFYDFPFQNSWMNRSLLVAETVFNGETFLVSTSHLESLDNRHKRAKQMNYIQNTLLKGFDSIFMGDFNFDYSWPDEVHHLDFNKFTDMWLALKDEHEECFTKNATTRTNPAVLDHVVLASDSQFKPDFIQRVGNFCCRNFSQDLINEIREDDIVRTPSDHLGLFSVISK